jgi:protein-arginine kinase activator protein McsA
MAKVLREKSAALAVRLPDRPASELAPPDSEKDWLFASDRIYPEQVEFYKERRPGRLSARREIACESCGTAFVAKRRDSVACSKACLVALYEQRRRGRREQAREDGVTRPCESCGSPFAPLRSTARFCSSVCAQRAGRIRRGGAASSSDAAG